MEQPNGKILVLDDDEDILIALNILLKPWFSVIKTIREPDSLMKFLMHDDFDVVVLDMNFSPGSTSGHEGLACLQTILKAKPDMNVVLMTAYGDIDLAVKGIKEGALDFIVKPWENKKLLATVHAAYSLSQKKREIEQLQRKQKTLCSDLDQQFREIIGTSAGLSEVIALVNKIAKTEVNVLILGENGTGKELIARAIHRTSSRHHEVFIRVDLGSLPETLFESELFGHVKGAFTDARDDRPGRFEIASGGTLFLDEIGNLPMHLQAKLLTAVQSKEIYRVGSNKPIPVNIRLISATNLPLHNLVNEKRFREDLLYRLNTVELKIPPLRERNQDIPLLVEHFIEIYSKKYQKTNLKVTDAVMKRLMQYPWPGNIRELEHVVERAIIMSENSPFKPSDFLTSETTFNASKEQNLNLVEIEKNTILTALRKNQGNLSAAARELGLGRTTLYRKMKLYQR